MLSQSRFEILALADVEVIVWWGQLAISPLWAQEQPSGHLLEIARARSDSGQSSFLPQRVPEICLPTVAMSSLLYSQPFGMPLSLHNRTMGPAMGSRTIWRYIAGPS